jgi:hypothetical protein
MSPCSAPSKRMKVMPFLKYGCRRLSTILLRFPFVYGIDEFSSFFLQFFFRVGHLR